MQVSLFNIVMTTWSNDTELIPHAHLLAGEASPTDSGCWWLRPSLVLLIFNELFSIIPEGWFWTKKTQVFSLKWIPNFIPPLTSHTVAKSHVLRGKCISKPTEHWLQWETYCGLDCQQLLLASSTFYFQRLEYSPLTVFQYAWIKNFALPISSGKGAFLLSLPHPGPQSFSSSPRSGVIFTSATQC